MNSNHTVAELRELLREAEQREAALPPICPGYKGARGMVGCRRDARWEVIAVKIEFSHAEFTDDTNDKLACDRHLVSRCREVKRAGWDVLVTELPR